MMSANTSDIDKLKDEDKVSEVYDYAENKLIIIKYKNSPIKNLKDISSPKKISLGEEKSVSAGEYAIEYMKKEKSIEIEISTNKNSYFSKNGIKQKDTNKYNTYFFNYFEAQK